MVRSIDMLIKGLIFTRRLRRSLPFHRSMSSSSSSSSAMSSSSSLAMSSSSLAMSSSSSSSSKLKVRFLIDRAHKRVVFAEAGSDFVDLLFSFLTLPLGRIVQLMSKNTGLGSLDSLYESVEQLDAKHLQSEACKEMLLSPRSPAAILCEDLQIKGILELNPRLFYTCSQDDCLIQSTCYYTYTTKCFCSRCGKFMDRAQQWRKTTSGEAVFIINDTSDFIITDDLQVTPVSSRMGLSVCKRLKIEDSCVLKEKIIEFGTKKALNLLWCSLVSKNALSMICFPEQPSGDFSLPIKDEFVADEARKQIYLELIMNKKTNNILYAEAGDDFVNQLVSFLTFPLGSVLKFLQGNMASLGGCIRNLYSSAERMNTDFFKSEISRKMLLTPLLSTFYGIKNEILEFEEIKSFKSTVAGRCVKCYFDNECKTCTSGTCVHGIRQSEYIEQNPKVSNSACYNDGAFVISSRRFMISDNLHISPLSLISALANGRNLCISDLVRREVCVDKDDVISLMTTMLMSERVLSDVFSPNSKRPRRSL